MRATSFHIRRTRLQQVSRSARPRRARRDRSRRHPIRSPSLALLVVLSAILLAACGGAGESSTNTTATSAKILPIEFSSPALRNHVIPALYTCDGRDANPPLKWAAAPPDTSELMIVLIDFKRARNGGYGIRSDWALAGINPRTRRLGPGERPPGSFLGLNADGRRGYDLCPPAHSKARYQFMIFALPGAVKLSHEFKTLPVLGTITRRNTEYTATAQGAFATSYARR